MRNIKEAYYILESSLYVGTFWEHLAIILLVFIIAVSFLITIKTLVFEIRTIISAGKYLHASIFMDVLIFILALCIIGEFLYYQKEVRTLQNKLDKCQTDAFGGCDSLFIEQVKVQRAEEERLIKQYKKSDI